MTTPAHSDANTICAGFCESMTCPYTASAFGAVQCRLYAPTLSPARSTTHRFRAANVAQFRRANPHERTAAVTGAHPTQYRSNDEQRHRRAMLSSSPHRRLAARPRRSLHVYFAHSCVHPLFLFLSLFSQYVLHTSSASRARLPKLATNSEQLLNSRTFSSADAL
eukprot:CAMPEP_0185836552 /NCGR_PEP_ID=MMETSP1353-20130828/9944_1 /TAXON_ID=1077150 /ORGANISM="Erythrolobus australicus, Strain CCMP3124" /LENGTH=164 /DNA_ID=CAMNT_0028535357 /DNA_START=517 /DNA_END=1009 /DNA_ORIENTATION=-